MDNFFDKFDNNIESNTAPIGNFFDQFDKKEKRTWGQYAADVAENVPRRFLQGATFGFGEELSSALAAAPSLLNNKDFNTEYAKNLAFQRAKLQEAKQENPYLGGAAEIGGAIGPGIAAVPSSVLRWAGSGGRLARTIKGAVVGAPVAGASGAVYGYGTGEGGAKERLGNAASMGATSAAAGAALPVVGSAIGVGAPYIGKVISKAVQPRGPQLTSEQLREIGSQSFKSAEAAGGALKPNLVDEFITNLSKKAPQTEAGKAIAGENAYSKMLERLQSLKGKPMTLEAAQEADSVLGDLAYSTLDKFGKVTNEGRLYQNAQQTLRKMIEDAGPEQLVNKGAFDTLKEARKFWSASLRMRDVERIINNAQYFEQPATAIRTGFRQMLRNKDSLKGFTKEEIKAIEKAATTGVVTDLFRLAGSGLGPIISGSAGAVAAGGPAGALAALPAYAVQQGAKAIAQGRQMSRAQGVSSAIQKSIEKTTGKNAFDLLKMLENGGTISREAIDALPDAEKKNFISRVMKLPVEQARKILTRTDTLKEK